MWRDDLLTISLSESESPLISGASGLELLQ